MDDVKPYSRTRVLHTPYNLRSKVSTSRYSIAGYPSLYLGTSLQLCCKECLIWDIIMYFQQVDSKYLLRGGKLQSISRLWISLYVSYEEF